MTTPFSNPATGAVSGPAHAPFGHAQKPHWPLDPELLYLNHGTVGSTPRAVLAAHQAIRDEVERNPSRFLLRELTAIRVGGPRSEPPRMRVAAAAVARALGAQADDLVFVDNITAGANAVLRSFDLGPGDEIAVTDLSYGGVVSAARYAARVAGAGVRVIEMPWPPTPGNALEAIVSGITPATRLAIVDHITSESALLLPIVEIVAALRARGVAVLVDGAHAPGAIALDLEAIGADWYTGNLHKWGWTPRSSGFLWARRERQAALHPTVISWGLDQGMTAEFDLVGTRDPSPHLAAPAAFAHMASLGTEQVRRWNHELAWAAGRHLAERWGTELAQPESMIGTMVTLPLPEACGSTAEDADRLRDALLFEDRIEVQLHAWRGRLWVRLSAQVYNEMSDFERLAEAVLARR